jgi:hypothetical protein
MQRGVDGYHGSALSRDGCLGAACRTRPSDSDAREECLQPRIFIVDTTYAIAWRLKHGRFASPIDGSKWKDILFQPTMDARRRNEKPQGLTVFRCLQCLPSKPVWCSVASTDSAQPIRARRPATSCDRALAHAGGAADRPKYILLLHKYLPSHSIVLRYLSMTGVAI